MHSFKTSLLTGSVSLCSSSLRGRTEICSFRLHRPGDDAGLWQRSGAGPAETHDGRCRRQPAHRCLGQVLRGGKAYECVLVNANKPPYFLLGTTANCEIKKGAFISQQDIMCVHLYPCCNLTGEHYPAVWVFLPLIYWDFVSSCPRCLGENSHLSLLLFFSLPGLCWASPRNIRGRAKRKRRVMKEQKRSVFGQIRFANWFWQLSVLTPPSWPRLKF